MILIQRRYIYEKFDACIKLPVEKNNKIGVLVQQTYEVEIRTN